ncbi:trans-aconitate 2-methyltransferase [Streptomyces sp. VRA16 Mangrove soil]|uniref:class I SAM-dependent methyltransferase n=1 Tax=Streptomyces sp. VRA16 Mangrove soil TaxID=2817434 RepID=UPI001A9CBF33|nr:class I SAM-dependent methyltransferase [Streptomyces sp. VRA16 Mangrove soil]MBO1337216.1 class I SAM-dependent methyltransferase [Streptomyces sp. VRA16 Mangrove soil]
MTDTERERLRRTFTEDAEVYDRARPGYPERLYDDLAELTGTGPGCRVLELGCGTGKATVPLAARGCRITAVELGPELAAVARRNLAGHPQVSVETGAFEEWPLPPEPFDVVLAATSFHWIDPAVRVAKSARALRPGGALATVSTHHVAGGTEQFFVDVQRCYERFDPTTPPGLRLTPAADIPHDSQEAPNRNVEQGNAALPGADRFEPPVFRRCARDLTFTTAEYLDLLRTFSGTRALDPAARAGLLDAIGQLIDGSYGGSVTKRYLTELRVARRKEG